MSRIMLFPARAITAISAEFLAGNGSIPALEDILIPIDEDKSLRAIGNEVFIDKELLEGLVREVLRLDFSDDSEMDSWLAPRLHYALRIPRRLAADPRFWTWLGVTVFRPYIQKRWMDEKKRMVNLPRYVDNNKMNLTQAVSRLWWGAEMCRNGRDYSPVIQVFSKVRTAQFALELAYSAYKPAAIAFARVCVESKPELSDKEKNRLSTMIRAYLSTTSLEMLGGPSNAQGIVVDAAWPQHRPTLEKVLGELASLEGPNDAHVSAESIDAVARWMSELITDIRQRKAA
jgi:hypothetical protein